MTLKTRITKLELKAPVDEIIEVLGVRMKASDFEAAMKSAEGTALRPQPEPNRYSQ